MLEIIEAQSESHVALVGELFVDYWNWLGFEPCFEGFDTELANLSAAYGPPRGCMLLALYDGEAAGAVGVKGLSNGYCEMKRLFARPGFRGKRVGFELVSRIIEEARKRGYSHMRLDTLPAMEKAISLYTYFGFKEIGQYREDPIPGAKYLELEL